MDCSVTDSLSKNLIHVFSSIISIAARIMLRISGAGK